MPNWRHIVAGLVAGAAVTHGTHRLADNDKAAYDRLTATLETEEGFRGFQYKDSEGHPTIGDGTLLPLTRAEAELLLKSRLADAENQLRKGWPPYGDALIEVQSALLDMAYELGEEGLLQFHHMLAALERQDYGEAARQADNSLWARQVPGREHRIAKIFRSLE